jgi:ribosome-associated toxin RatA of RatAB toxin-antitoxin module
MSGVERSALVPYSAEQMFALVDAVERYPEFLPWCSGTRVRQRDAEITVAEIGVSYRGIRQSFATRNRKNPPSSMSLELVDGPFRRLDGEWRFTGLGEHACRVDFRLHYEFSGGLLDRLFAPVFNHIAESMMDAFMRRAEHLHGGS